MKRFFKITAVILSAVILFAVCGYFFLTSKEAQYQKDAGKKRINDVYKIASLLEQCKTTQGYYPFKKHLSQPQAGYEDIPVAVMLSQDSQEWLNRPFPFKNRVAKSPATYLIKELETCLNQNITLPVDPQHAPYLAPNTYIVLFTNDDSYAIIAFLYDEHEYASPLAEHVNAFTVSSETGPAMEKLMYTMLIKPKKFSEITNEEKKAAQIEGEKMDKLFSKWAKTEISE